MDTFNKFLAGAFFLIALYLLFNSQYVSDVFSSFASGASGVFGTLQGRNVNIGNVQIQGGIGGI